MLTVEPGIHYLAGPYSAKSAVDTADDIEILVYA